jgi:DNA-binding NarL/FixJ family response regulator
MTYWRGSLVPEAPGTDHPHVSEPRPSHPIRVLIVDDDRRVRQSLSGLMALRDEIEVVGTAGDGEAALALCHAAAPDTVLLDLRLPETTDGFSLLQELRHRWPRVRVVAMSVQVSLRAAAIAAGAAAFIPKGGQPEAIGDALVALGASPSA